MCPHALIEGLEYLATFYRHHRAVLVGMVDQLMHVSSQDLLLVGVLYPGEGCFVAKGTTTVGVYAINALSRRIKKQADGFFAFFQGCFGLLARRTVFDVPFQEKQVVVVVVHLNRVFLYPACFSRGGDDFVFLIEGGMVGEGFPPFFKE